MTGEKGLDQALVHGVPPTSFLIRVLDQGMMLPGGEVEAVIDQNFKPQQASSARIREGVVNGSDTGVGRKEKQPGGTMGARITDHGNHHVA